ncbi:OBG-type G domain-containing protein, partial [Haematococcus lacustris]
MRWCRLRKHLNPIQRAAAVAHEDVLGTSRSGPYTQEEESDEVSLGGAGPAVALLPDPFAPRAPPPAILGLPAAVTATPVLELELGQGSQGWAQEEESDEVSLGGAGPAVALLPDPFAPRAPPPAILGLPAAVTATPVLELELGQGSQGWGAARKKRRVGVLQSVPQVAPTNEHLASALKRASRVVASATIKNEAEKERHRAARQMDTLMK